MALEISRKSTFEGKSLTQKRATPQELGRALTWITTILAEESVNLELMLADRHDKHVEARPSLCPFDYKITFDIVWLILN
jgi:hypothetical protein